MPELPDFSGLRVAALESRRADEMARLIERHGGQPHVSPSMRETSLEDHTAAREFAQAVVDGRFDVVIFMTGVGFRRLLEALAAGDETSKEATLGDKAAKTRFLPSGDKTLALPAPGRSLRDRFLEALPGLVTIARGPKPVAAMKEVGLSPTHRVGEPNTWREILAHLDSGVPVAGRAVGVQEYGKPNPQFVAGLESRGARVTTVQIYRWELPEDVRPLEENIRAIAAGQRDVVLFTSAQQAVHLIEMAGRLGLESDVRAALRRMVIASIGPTTSEMLRDEGLAADLEPEHPHMGQLVVAAARQAGELLAAKRSRHSERSEPPVPAAAAPNPARAHPSDDGPFLRACRRQPTNVTPIWLMRQAGRYLPEYREIRSKVSFLDFCKNPQLSAEVMIRTVERLGVDAAIIFSDLLPILEPMGLQLEFQQGEGPVIHNPVRAAADVDRVRELESAEFAGGGPLDFVMQTVRHTRAGLPPRIPVIGFAGAPFTLASYVIEGGGSRDYAHTKRLMLGDEGAWHELLSRLARSVARYLNGQIAAGAQCVQLFDSWAGCLHPDDYRRYVLPHTRGVIEAITPGTPVINFATGNPALLPLLSEAGGDVIGIDWRVRLDDAWQTVGHHRGVQGNLDPTTLLADQSTIRRRAKDILDQAAGRPGHIFNLGHGVLPPTPPENVIALVEMVHEMSAR